MGKYLFSDVIGELDDYRRFWGNKRHSWLGLFIILRAILRDVKSKEE